MERSKERLESGDSCLAKLPGKSPWFRALVKEALPKGYIVDRVLSVRDEREDLVRVTEKCCKRAPGFRKSASLEPESPVTVKRRQLLAEIFAQFPTSKEREQEILGKSPGGSLPVRVSTAGSPLKQPKPQPVARSDAYLDRIRAQPCWHCGQLPRSEAHHEGRRGVAQKCSDFLAVPLCNKCHFLVTNKHRLPKLNGTGLHTIAETKKTLCSAQRVMLVRLLDALDSERAVALLAAVMPQLEEGEIRAVAT